jgi:hypothetical protein
VRRKFLLQMVDGGPLRCETFDLSESAIGTVGMRLRWNRSKDTGYIALVVSLGRHVPGRIEFVIPGGHEQLQVVVSVFSALIPLAQG